MPCLMGVLDKPYVGIAWSFQLGYVKLIQSDLSWHEHTDYPTETVLKYTTNHPPADEIWMHSRLLNVVLALADWLKASGSFIRPLNHMSNLHDTFKFYRSQWENLSWGRMAFEVVQF